VAITKEGGGVQNRTPSRANDNMTHNPPSVQQDGACDLRSSRMKPINAFLYASGTIMILRLQFSQRSILCRLCKGLVYYQQHKATSFHTMLSLMRATEQQGLSTLDLLINTKHGGQYFSSRWKLGHTFMRKGLCKHSCCFSASSLA